jgi:SAM-dependent methyltransferase
MEVLNAGHKSLQEGVLTKMYLESNEGLKSTYEPCPFCNSNEWTGVREGCDLCRPKYKKSFKLTRCSSCGYVMQNPRPSDLELSEAYSASSNYDCYRPGWPVWKILRAWTTRRRISRLRRYGIGHEMLEVGCGAGDFLVAAHHAGWNVRAVEYNSSMADSIRSELGLDVRAGELALGLWDEEQIDVVAFWNVIEHLQDPLRELFISARYLRTGGRVFISIPTRQAAEYGQSFGQYWALLDLPRHLHFYDKTTLSRLCDKAGFELVVYETPFVQSAWGYYMSSWRWANRDGERRLPWFRFLALALVVTMFMPVVALRAMRKQGFEAFAVAVKR